ncbi:MAG: acetoacetate decarboxylase family protein [Leptolyngbyaceae cyanobacterium SL_7_1]|nr:acetoacetate decarboxylase family protein [Leptolyngbyaceae cyanobacterium SL_7_1]
MSPPPAPWTLNGFAYVSLQLVDWDKAYAHVPSHLTLLSVLPGYTLGGIYLASYGTGSTLPYSELIVIPGLVQLGNTVGAWISHIYVDNPDSVAGGRQIWGLPKEMAEFDWQADRTRVTVQQGDRLLCDLQTDWHLSLWRQPFVGNVFSQIHSTLMQFVGKASFQPALTGAQVYIPPTAPFANLGLDRPLVVVGCQDLDLWVEAPRRSPGS